MFKTYPKKLLIAFLTLYLIGFVRGQSIPTPPLNTTRAYGGIAVFQCQVKFGAFQEMTWDFNDQIIYSFLDGDEEYPLGNTKYFVARAGGDFNLTVHDLNYDDGGTYTCAAFAPTATAFLVVLGTPSLTFYPAEPKEDDLVIITCKAEFGGPKKDSISQKHFPQLQMFLDGVLLENTVPHSSDQQLNMTFNLTAAVSTKGAVVTCEIRTENPTMSQDSSSKVDVLYSVRNISFSPSPDGIGIGSILTCSADGNPQPSFEWTNVENPGQKIKERRFTITDDMVGNNVWRCTGRNWVGEMFEEDVIAIFNIVAQSSPLGTIMLVIIIIIIVLVLLGTGYKFRRNIHGFIQKKENSVKADCDPMERVPLNESGSEVESPKQIHDSSRKTATIKPEIMNLVSKSTSTRSSTLHHQSPGYPSPITTTMLKPGSVGATGNSSPKKLFSSMFTTKQKPTSILSQQHDLNRSTVLQKRENFITSRSSSPQSNLTELRDEQKVDQSKKKDHSHQTEYTLKSEDRAKGLKDLTANFKLFLKKQADPTCIQQLEQLSADSFQKFKANNEDLALLDETDRNVTLLHNLAEYFPILCKGNKEMEHEAYLELIKRISHAQQNVNDKDDQDCTVLHILADKFPKEVPEHCTDTFIEVMKHFINYPGMNTNLKDKQGQTFLHRLAKNYTTDMPQHCQEVFLQIAEFSGKSVEDKRDDKGNTVLHILAGKCSWQISEDGINIIQKVMKLFSKLCINIRNNEQCTILHILVKKYGKNMPNHCQKVFFDLFKYFLTKANIDGKDSQGNTVLHTFMGKYPNDVSEAEIFLKIVNHIVQIANKDIQDEQGCTALHILLEKYDHKTSDDCRNIFHDLVKKVKSERNINIKNKQGHTARQILEKTVACHPELEQGLRPTLKLLGVEENVNSD